MFSIFCGIIGRIRRQGALEEVWIRHLRGHEEPTTVVAYVRAMVERAGLQDWVEIRKVEHGPMPLLNVSADIVSNEDLKVHTPDKEALVADAFRVLKPGGWFVASDWLISHDGKPSLEMADYIAREDLNF